METRVKTYKELGVIANANCNILQIGYGAVGRVITPIMFKLVAFKSYTIIDKLEQTKFPGAEFRQVEITKSNYDSILGEYLNNGDILIDAAYSIGTYELVTWCQKHGVRFFNMSVEEFEPFDPRSTLYERNEKIRNESFTWKGNTPTMILDTGMNPGWVSAMVKYGLIAINNHFKLGCDSLLKAGCFAEAARKMDLRTIHITEKDTQVTTKPRMPYEFCNTWSVSGFAEEVSAPAELGFGTHETELPLGAVEHMTGPKNQIYLQSRGCNKLIRSYTRMGEFIGMLVRHGESYSISSRLSFEENGRCVYRPSVYFVYLPCDAGLASIHKLREVNYHLPEDPKLLRNLYEDITSGVDEIGCLLMGGFGKWWCGSSLDIHEARALMPDVQVNATTIQAAGSLVASVIYSINHPDEGLRFVDDIDHIEFLRIANLFMGPVRSSLIDEPPNAPKSSCKFSEYEVTSGFN